MGKVAKDKTGMRFGRLTVLSRAENVKPGRVRWICKCDCGNQTIVYSNNLKENGTLSCGCYRREVRCAVNKRRSKHGLAKSRLYRIWFGIKRRCYSESGENYERYCARGIKVCDEWINSFESFRDWAMSHGYSDDLSIDRIDNDGDYTPDNCRWVNAKIQGNNRSTNRVLEYGGRKLNVTQWANEVGLNKKTLEGRLLRGWSVEKALTTPVKERRKSNGRKENTGSND